MQLPAKKNGFSLAMDRILNIFGIMMVVLKRFRMGGRWFGVNQWCVYNVV